MSINESGAHTRNHGSHASAPPAYEWPEIDGGLLQERVSEVPPFPLDLLPQPWRDWVGDTARAVGAPDDYVAQAVLAAAAGIRGSTLRIRVSSAWEEPLLLWLALVGPSSSGKSPALASLRRLLGELESEASNRSKVEGQGAGDDPGARIISSPCTLAAIAAAVAEDKRGPMLWRDEPSSGFALLGRGGAEVASLPLNVLCSLEPDRLAQTLHDGGDGMAARFLYAWPRQPAYCPLTDRKPAADHEAASMLSRIKRLPGTVKHPYLLIFDEAGVEALDGLLGSIHARLREIEGLEAAWLGKGGGTVARLAGALELLAWSATDAPNPGPIGAEQVECAASLWWDYFWPHARESFDRGAPTDVERRARRVVRWIRTTGVTEVSRERVRREALGRTVDAAKAHDVLDRLTADGVLRQLPLVFSEHGGRPPWRWQVNPALAALAGRAGAKGAKGGNPHALESPAIGVLDETPAQRAQRAQTPPEVFPTIP